jgi:hypothetical protein
MPHLGRRRSLPGGTVLTLAGGAAIAFATLRPSLSGIPRRSPWCLVCGESGVLDVLLNSLLFIPLGVGLARLGIRHRWAVAILLATTLAVEVTQYLFIVGREGTVSDVLTNTFGGWVGLLLGTRLEAGLFPPRRLARVLAGSWGTVLLAVWLAMAFAFQRATPSGVYDTQWAPKRPRLDSFPGRVLSVAVNARTAPPSARLPAAWVASDSMLRLDAWIVPGPPTTRTAPIAIVASNNSHDVAFLGQNANSLVFATRLRASEWRLKTPHIVLDDAIPTGGELDHGSPTADLRVAGMRTARTLAVEAEWRDGGRRLSVDVTPSLGWVLLLPFHYSLQPGYRTASAMWVAAWFAPLGYWSAAGARDVRARRGSRSVVWLIPVAVLVVGLAVIPLAFGYARCHWSEWAAAWAGIAGGWALFRAADRLMISRAE